MRKTVQVTLMAATLGITVGTAHAQSGSKPAPKPATQSSESKKADEGFAAKVDPPGR